MLQKDLSFRKRMPRLLMADSQEPLTGIDVVWSTKEAAPVLDLSYSGVHVASKGFLSRFKLSEDYHFQIRLPQLGHVIPVDMKLVKITGTSLGFAFSAPHTEGRLKLDQNVKDYLVVHNLKPSSPHILHPYFHDSHWWHGPFDTNVFVWREGGEIIQAIVEYDHLMLRYQGDGWEIRRTPASNDEAKGYYAPYMDESTQRVAMGASWLDRMTKVIAPLVFEIPGLPDIFNSLRRK